MSLHQQTHLSLVVPGLFGPVPESHIAALDASQFRLLARFLARSDYSAQRPRRYHDALYSLFEPEVEGNSQAPVAAVCRYLQTGQMDYAFWLRIDPVHLSADKDRLYMFGNHMLALRQDEAEQLIFALQELYADQNWVFEYYHPQQWYMRLAADPTVRFHALESAMGHPIDTFMPEGPERDEWLRFLNEVQMLFHSHDVNQQRMLRNEYTVNSVWCWGEGRLPVGLQSCWHAVHSENIFVQGLAMLCGCPASAVPASADELLGSLPASSGTDTDRQILVVIEKVENARIGGDPGKWLEQLQHIQDHWLSPLLQALGHGKLGSITLDPCNGSKYRYVRNHRMRVWRRTREFRDYLRHA